MKRCKKTRHENPRYPDLRAFLRRHCRRAGVGLVVGAVATSGCDLLDLGIFGHQPDRDTGRFDTETDGLIGETAETYSLLLPATGSHDLWFSEPYGWIAYHLLLTVEDWRFADWLEDNPGVALEIADSIIGAAPVTDYAEDDGFEALESALAAALSRAYLDATSAQHADFVGIDLFIDGYEDEGYIDGDIELQE